MSTPTAQDVFGVPIVASVGQQCLVLGTVTAMSGSGPTAQYTVKPFAAGNPGDTTNTITCGPKQLQTLQHNPLGLPSTITDFSQDVFGHDFGRPTVGTNPGNTVLVRTIVQTISGSGITASITCILVNANNIGDLNGSIVIGPSQCRVQQVS